jgi:integrase
MSRRRSFSDPSYRLHRQSGQAVVTLADGLGGRRDVLLGKYGTPDESPESWARYYQVLAEWKTNGRRLPTPDAQRTSEDSLTVNELILHFWQHVERHYRHPDGRPTSEQENYKIALRPLKELYGHASATSFGPKALKAVREKMIASVNPNTGLPWCRKSINQRIDRIKRLFKWAVGEELVPPGVLQAILAVKGLQKGRTEARESEPVTPVPDTFVEAVLPLVRPQVQAMIQLQLLTGMRPSEVCGMRGIDLDLSGRVWFYRPSHHKTAWRGKPRVIAIGPKAQEVLKKWLRLNVEEPLFQPREAEALRDAERSAARKSKRTPSQLARKAKKNPRRRPGVCYTVLSYGKAIDRAAEKAGVPAWNPNQLRHSHGTEVRRQFGLEAAQVALGHSQANVTEVYAERDLGLAERIAAEIG